ncbi:transcriptional regulator [Hoyosella sp. G463]|uniref:Transcriptional regulator n=1 Tax=Lolliginicoccus lacisalsi TaxID=2742202 RepID=A0A927JDA5_9ACTN|nr:transcriptional regulator [Lolliginicoccus lacisalsi]
MSTSEHPISGLDDTVHQRARLGILSLLSTGVAMEFPAVRATLGLTDGNLNRHLAVLERAGLGSSSRQTGRGRPKTWLEITRAGQAALDAELDALRKLIAATEQGRGGGPGSR